MADLPSRFTTDLEESLPLRPPPPEGPFSSSQHTTTTTTTTTSPTHPRNWDDPPADDPPASPDTLTTTMLFLNSHPPLERPYHQAEIMHLAFSPSDAHLTAILPRTTNGRTSANRDEPLGLAAWALATGRRLPVPTGSGSALGVSGYGFRAGAGGFAVKPETADLVVACPYMMPVATSQYHAYAAAPVPRVEVYDLGRRERVAKGNVGVRAPVAWSADGGVLVGVSVREPSRVVVLAVPPRGKDAEFRVGRVLMGHFGEVTQLAFLPPWESAGRALVSAGRDGFVRVTCVDTGRTLKRVEVAARAPASMLQVSKDGKLVVTVWGRDVVLWYLETGKMQSYNLDRVRQNEGWPLCVSPDCRYIACRNEEGFDVSDVETGKFRGEFVWTGQTITAGAFNSDGVQLAIGDYGGGVQVFDVITS